MDKLKVFNDTYMEIVEKGNTPYVLVAVRDDKTIVPKHLVKDGRIVFNISMRAAKDLMVTAAGFTFGGAFGGKHYSISVPMDAVMAIYGREDAVGVLFEIPKGIKYEYHHDIPMDAPKEEVVVEKKVNPFRVVK